jgi:hypothetical protein
MGALHWITIKHSIDRYWPIGVDLTPNPFPNRQGEQETG